MERNTEGPVEGIVIAVDTTRLDASGAALDPAVRKSPTQARWMKLFILSVIVITVIGIIIFVIVMKFSKS